MLIDNYINQSVDKNISGDSSFCSNIKSISQTPEKNPSALNHKKVSNASGKLEPTKNPCQEFGGGSSYVNVPVQLLSYIFKPKWREYELSFIFFLYVRKHTENGFIDDKQAFIRKAAKDYGKSYRTITRYLNGLLKTKLIEERKKGFFVKSIDRFANLLEYEPEKHQKFHSNRKMAFVSIAVPLKQFSKNSKKTLYDIVLFRNQNQQQNEIKKNALNLLPVSNAQRDKILKRNGITKNYFVKSLISAILNNSLNSNHEIAQIFNLNKNDIDRIYNKANVKQVMSCIGLSKKINRKSASTASKQFKKLEVERRANIIDTGMIISSKKELYEIRELYDSHCYLFVNKEGKVFQKMASLFYSTLKDVKYQIPRI